MAKITFVVEEELKVQLTKLAEENGISLSEQVRLLVKTGLKFRKAGWFRRLIKRLF